jgi:CMP/dCMP kinase
MIITIAGKAGAGKSTVAKLIARKLNLTHYSTGDFMRDIAEENKIDLLELSKRAEKDRSIDEELDQRQIELGNKKENFIIDGRLSWHFIPKSIKIFIDARLDIRAERIYHDTVRREHNVSLETTKKKLKERENSEQKRYKEYYNLNPHDHKNYDLVVDSSNIDQDEVTKRILEFVKDKD